MKIDPIDVEWAQKHVDQLIEVAQSLGPGAMKDALMLRAQHVLDFVEAWKEHKHGIKPQRRPG